MDTVAGGSMRLIEGARGLIHSAFVALMQRAINSGDLRADTDPDDFVRALVGVFHTDCSAGLGAECPPHRRHPYCRLAPSK